MIRVYTRNKGPWLQISAAIKKSEILSNFMPNNVNTWNIPREKILTKTHQVFKSSNGHTH